MSDIPQESPPEVVCEPSGMTEAADLQLAIFAVAKRAEGSSVEEARRMLCDEIERRHITPASGLWVDAAATSAALGKPYIVSNEARWAAEAVLRDSQCP